MRSLHRRSPRSRLLAAILLLLAVAACIKVRVEPVTASLADTSAVRAPTRVHLLDGSTVVFNDGFVPDGGALRGTGVRYDLQLIPRDTVNDVPLDSIVGAELVTRHTDAGASIGWSLVGGLVSALAAGALAVAIFGSCPTIYYDSAGTATLESEAFSYSIAPMFAARDVDRLRVLPDADGIVRLEVRNEALETHYIDALELIEVQHAPGEYALPDPLGRPIAAGGLVAPGEAHDRHGRALAQVLGESDGEAVGSDDAVLAAARVGDMEDRLELTFPLAAARGDSVALVLRLRNSLLNTVLFYDIMLGDRGAYSLDWMHEDLAEIAPALELGQWYTTVLGMRVEVEGDEGWTEVARIRDVGPIAWKDLGVMLPRAGGSRAGAPDSIRVRLSYVPDNWRIDRAALATTVSRPVPTVHTIQRLRDRGGADLPDALASARAADDQHLRTWPAQAFTVEWDVEPAPADEARTFFLAAHGYYIEWIRRGWMEEVPRQQAFVPSDDALLDALRRWRTARPTMEAQFMASRFPVR